MSNLIPRPGTFATQPGTLAKVAEYFAQAQSDNTRVAYASDWRDFAAWCSSVGACAMPATAETLSYYLVEVAQYLKVSTLQRRLAAISQAHQALGHDTPTKMLAVRKLMAGIRREKGVAQGQKQAITVPQLRAMVKSLDASTALGVRNKALLLLGFAGAFRRSELVALNWDDLEMEEAGMVATIRRSKTDQEGAGRKAGIPYGSTITLCPVRAVLAWRTALGQPAVGPVFVGADCKGVLHGRRLDAQTVALIVKGAAKAAGLDPAAFAGHSLRAGLATEAAKEGVSERDIAKQTGHKSMMVLRKYIRDGSLFRDNAAKKVL